MVRLERIGFRTLRLTHLEIEHDVELAITRIRHALSDAAVATSARRG
jgi:hypothetical protein